jgi:Uma2 family endonuclease
MAGGSLRHSLITVNISSALRPQLRKSGCSTFSSDAKVCISRGRMIAYPDVTVVCGEPDFLDARRDVLKNPTVLVEVLSPSTENYDRGKKATFYRLLPSLREFLLVEQEPVFVEHNRRMDDGTWQVIIYQEAEGVIPLSSIGVELPVTVIYEEIEQYS